MKKKILIIFAIVLLVLPSSPIFAANFEGQEAYYRDFCSVERTNANDIQTCNDFRQYLIDKSGSLDGQIANMDKELQGVKNDINALGDLINTYNVTIKSLEESISTTQNSIDSISAEVTRLDGQIQVIQGKIDIRNEKIKKRMVAEQPRIGTNMYFDFIMGAKDLMDLLRMVDGMDQITQNDQRQIELMVEDKTEMDAKKSEQKRLQGDAEFLLANQETDKAAAVAMKTKTQEAINSYNSRKADLEQQMRSKKVDIEALKAYMPAYNNGIGDGVTNDGWMRPISGSYISAGTWYYPQSFGGGLHLGVDYAVGMGTPILAPADSIVLYANNPSPSVGFLGNWGAGNPAGGGNTIHLLTSVNGVTYALSFFHLSQSPFPAKGRTNFAQGEVIGYVGSSGNSSGAHSHIEVFNLGGMSLQAAVDDFARRGDWSHGSGWNSPGGSRIRPETIFP